MVKLIIFSILIVIVISAFSLDLSFITEGFSLIINYLTDLPYMLELTQNVIRSVLDAPVIRTLILFGITFLIIKWLVGLVGDNDEEHIYKD